MAHNLTHSQIQQVLEQLANSAAFKSGAHSERVCQQLDLVAAGERITRGRQPGLELVNDRFVRALRETFTALIGRTCTVAVKRTAADKFGRFVKTLPLPSSIHIFRLAPLSGQAVLVLSPALVFAVIDSMFGGRGRTGAKKCGREFTALETRLVGKAALLALENLKESWAPLAALEPVYVRSEQNPLAVAIAAASDSAAIVEIEAAVGQESGALFLCYPQALLEPLRDKLASGFHAAKHADDGQTADKMAANILDAEVELRVLLGRGRIKAGALLGLKPGDVLPLDAFENDQALILVEGRPKYAGTPGEHARRKAVRIDGVLKKRP